MTTIRPRPPVLYREVLRVPLRWWVQAVMFVASFWLAFVVALPASVAWAITAALAALTIALLVGYGSARLEVAGGSFRAGPARIPVRHLREPVPLDREAAALLFGRHADARAYHLLRGYARYAVRVMVDDPGDPVPYWLVSTRRPVELAAALSSAIGSADALPEDTTCEAGSDG